MRSDGDKDTERWRREIGVGGTGKMIFGEIEIFIEREQNNIQRNERNMIFGE